MTVTSAAFTAVAASMRQPATAAVFSNMVSSLRSYRSGTPD
jgi:hypothetical protein